MATPPYGEQRHAPADEAIVIDISAADHTLAKVSRGIYVGGDGDVKVNMSKTGTGVTFVGAKAGSVLPIQVQAVIKLGTTATSLVALY